MCIIFATDTVIQVLAVMVKLLHASLASLAVMAAKVHSASTLPTLHQFAQSVVPWDFDDEVIDWIITSNVAIVVDHDYHEAVGGRDQNPKNRVLESNCSCSDEDCMQGHNCYKQKDSEDLLEGWFLGVRVDFVAWGRSQPFLCYILSNNIFLRCL